MGVKLKVDIDLDGKDNSAKAFASAKASAQGLASIVTAVSTGYLAVAQILERIARLAAAPVQAAIAGEASARKLANALKVSGQYTEANVKSMSTYASAMQMAAGMSDDLLNDINAANVIMLRSADNAQALTSASIGLAKAFGMDVRQANEMLVASLLGQDRALKKLIPGIASMSEAQMKAGGAVRYVSDMFSVFITDDADTVGGKLARLTEQFGELAEAMGLSFLEGLRGSGVFAKLFDVMEGAQAQLQGDAFKQLGLTIGTFVRENLDSLMSWLKISIDLFDLFVKGLDKVRLAFEIVADVIVNTALKAQNVFLRVKALFVAGNRSIFDVQGMLDSYKKSSGEIETSTKLIDENYNNIAANVKKLFSVGSNSPPLADLLEKKFEAPKVPTFQNPKLAADRSSQDAELNFRRALDEKLLQLQLGQENELVQAHYKAMQEIANIEQDAAQKGINVTAQANQVRIALANNYARLLRDQRTTDEAQILRSGGKISLAIAKEYEIQAEAYKKLRMQDRITEAEYQAAILEARRKSAIEQRQTSGTAAKDDALNTVSQMVGAVQGGLNSVIQAIGSKFGVIGNVVASIVTFFNQAPKEFAAMLDGIHQAALNLPQTLVNNIAILWEKLPQMFADAMEQTYTASFWTGLLKGLWTGLVNMFKNFWSMLFGGEMINSAQKQNDKLKKVVSFGSDKANAGSSEFKIKDAGLSAERRVTQSFEESFAETVQEGGKGFVALLGEAWDKMIAKIRDFFDGLFQGLGRFIGEVGSWISHWGTEIWKGLSTAAKTIWKWGEEIWNGFWKLASASWEFIKSIGTAIFNAFWSAFTTIWDMLKNAGTQIFNGFWSAFVGIWDWFTSAGASLFNGFWNAFVGIWEWFKSAGSTIFNGLWDGIVSIWDNFTTMGSNIAAGLWNGIVGLWDKLVDVGKRIAEGIFGGISKVGETGGNFFESIGSGVKKIFGFSQGGAVHESMSNRGLAKAMIAGGALAFASGGMVPGTGFSDTVPAVLTPGERVLSRSEVAAGSGNTQVVNLSINIASGARVDREAVKDMMPMIIEQLKRESKYGALVVRPSGVY